MNFNKSRKISKKIKKIRKLIKKTRIFKNDAARAFNKICKAQKINKNQEFEKKYKYEFLKNIEKNQKN